MHDSLFIIKKIMFPNNNVQLIVLSFFTFVLDHVAQIYILSLKVVPIKVDILNFLSMNGSVLDKPGAALMETLDPMTLYR